MRQAEIPLESADILVINNTIAFTALLTPPFKADHTEPSHRATRLALAPPAAVKLLPIPLGAMVSPTSAYRATGRFTAPAIANRETNMMSPR
jgi:hypothetical protein